MPKKNGFFYFMLEYKHRKEAEGTSFRNLAQVTPDAGKIWEKMNAKQREPYIQKAKSTQSEGGLRKMNSLGIAISEVEKQLRSKEEHAQMIKNLVAERVASAESRNELDKEVMYIISLAYFGHTLQHKYIPAELGVVKYSLRGGVMDRLHMYINPGKIPLGAALSVDEHTNETHKLPLPPHSWGTTYMNEIAVKLISFLGADDEIPPLFTDEEKLPIVEDMLRDLLEDCIYGKTLYVCPLSEQFCHLKQATERHFMERSEFPSALTAQHILKMDSYGYAVGISCEYHEKELNMYHCALSQATRWAYTLSKYCCLHMGIECVPGKHTPPEIPAGDNKPKAPTASGSGMVAKQETSDDSSSGDKSDTQQTDAKWLKKMQSPAKKESLYTPIPGSVSYTPHKGGVIAYTGINLAAGEFYDDQTSENLFPTLSQSMGTTGNGRRQQRGGTSQRGGRFTRRRGA